MANEADTCRKFVVPRLQAAGWENEPHSLAEQRFFTDGRIVVRGNRAERKPRKRANYTLEKVRTLCTSPENLRARWADASQRAEILQQLAERGMDFPPWRRRRASRTLTRPTCCVSVSDMFRYAFPEILLFPRGPLGLGNGFGRVR